MRLAASVNGEDPYSRTDTIETRRWQWAAGCVQVGILLVATVIGLPCFFFTLLALLDHFEQGLTNARGPLYGPFRSCSSPRRQKATQTPEPAGAAVVDLPHAVLARRRTSARAVHGQSGARRHRLNPDHMTRLTATLRGTTLKDSSDTASERPLLEALRDNSRRCRAANRLRGEDPDPMDSRRRARRCRSNLVPARFSRSRSRRASARLVGADQPMTDVVAGPVHDLGGLRLAPHTRV